MYSQDEKKIMYDELAEMNQKIIGRMIEYDERRGPIVRFVHKPSAIEFTLGWLQSWDYSKGSGFWGEKTWTDGSYKINIPKKEFKSSVILPSGAIKILQKHKGQEEEYEYSYIIRADLGVGAMFFSIVIQPLLHDLKKDEQVEVVKFLLDNNSDKA